MAHAYTPGLRVAKRIRVRRRRILPMSGKVLVEQGRAVSAADVVARAELPGDVVLVNAVSKLNISPGELSQYLLKKPGDSVQRDELIAETKPLIKWFRSQLRSPIDGTIESVSSVTGQMILRGPAKPVDVTGYLDGRIFEVIENEGVEVETIATLVQGIFGIGGEAHGPLAVISKSPDDDLRPEDLHESLRGKVAVGGAFAGGAALRRAAHLGLAGVIVGGFHDSDLRELLGYDLGVAITGTEQVGITLIMTEGFGRIPMAKRTFELLASREGARASINGATQIRAGVIRPEIVIPWESDAAPAEAADEAAGGLDVGSAIRVIREPYFGRLGRVAALPPELREVDSEVKVRVAEIEFADGQRVMVPRANLERLEA